MYSRITASSRPTVETKYPRARNAVPQKCASALDKANPASRAPLRFGFLLLGQLPEHLSEVLPQLRVMRGRSLQIALVPSGHASVRLLEPGASELVEVIAGRHLRDGGEQGVETGADPLELHDQRPAPAADTARRPRSANAEASLSVAGTLSSALAAIAPMPVTTWPTMNAARCSPSVSVIDAQVATVYRNDGAGYVWGLPRCWLSAHQRRGLPHCSHNRLGTKWAFN